MSTYGSIFPANLDKTSEYPVFGIRWRHQTNEFATLHEECQNNLIVDEMMVPLNLWGSTVFGTGYACSTWWFELIAKPSNHSAHHSAICGCRIIILDKRPEWLQDSQKFFVLVKYWVRLKDEYEFENSTFRHTPEIKLVFAVSKYDREKNTKNQNQSDVYVCWSNHSRKNVCLLCVFLRCYTCVHHLSWEHVPSNFSMHTP